MRKAYKLCRIDKNGILHPMFVNTKDVFRIGTWIYAEDGPRNDKGKVISKLGPLAYRPGLHLSEAPFAPHIGIKAGGKIVYMHDDTVWVEVEIYDEIDYTMEARMRGTRNGKVISSIARLDRIPIDGFYYYNTNPNAYGNWLICHRMRITRVLTDDQVENICWTLFHIHAMPHRPGYEFTMKKGA